MRRISAALLFVLLLPCCVFAQEGSATLTGFIQDSSKAVIPGAKVTAIDSNTNQHFDATTGKDGSYTIVSLPVGPYELEVEKPGFKTILKDDLFLHTQDALEINFQMAVGSASESITVSADTTNDSPAVSMVVTREFVESMPLNGRSFQDLIALAPGTVNANASSTGSADGTEGLFSINGQRGDANYFTVDGVSAGTGSAVNSTGLDPRGLAGVLPAQTALGTTQGLTSVDDLQEFKVQTSGYSAENGRQPGGQVQFTTRSGTNDLHGSVYDYFRNEALDANSYYFNANSIARQPERQNDFGGTFGGPVRIPEIYNGKDETFYFGSYEGLRLRLPNFASIGVPTVAFRQFAGPVWQSLLNSYPTPNGRNNGDECAVALNVSYNFSCMALWNGALPNSNALDSGNFRIDQIVKKRLQLFARYANTQSHTSAFSVQGHGSDQGISSARTQGATAGATLRVSPHVTEELRFGWTEDGEQIQIAPSTLGGAIPYPIGLVVPAQYARAGALVSTANVLELRGPTFFDLIIPPGYSRFEQNVHQYNLVDDVAWVRGSHALKFGADWRRLRSLYDSGQYQSSMTSLSAVSVQQGVADYLLVSASQPGYPTFTNLSLYLEDSWKVGSRLIVDYGVRWEFNPVPGAVNGLYPLALTTGNLSEAQLAPAGTPQYRTSYDHFAPRIGFSYQVKSLRGRALVVRGGFGIFYDTGQAFGANGYTGYPFFASTPYLTNVVLPASPSELAPPSLNTPLVAPYGSLSLNDPDLTLPYTESWNLSLGQNLTDRNTLTVSYVGNEGKKLLYTYQYGGAAFGQPLPQNPLFTTLSLTSNAASSNYNALEVQDQGYVAPGMQAIASYTWAHAFDNTSEDEGSYPPVWGNSDNDIRQVFNVALNYQISGGSTGRIVRALSHGWSLSQRFTAQSGQPIQVVQNVYVNSSNSSLLVIPNLVKGVPVVLRNVSGDPFGWALNTSAFAPVPINADGSPVQQGNLPRNYVHGPGFWNLTSSVQRNVPFGEQLALSFRVEAFNIINHPNAGNPDPCLCDGNSFGLIGVAGPLTRSFGVPNPLYTTGAPRSLQLSLKLAF
ncbi:MAG TPA: carboxypeptidase regulatory-like domain-containing protein [Terracidiphilus sp.]|jgi:hypothetical protein